MHTLAQLEKQQG